MMRRLIRSALDYLFGYDFFIAYAHADGSRYVSDLAERLQSPGLDFHVFLDTHVYVAGDVLGQATARRVRMSTYMILVIRPHAMNSEWVLREAQQCLDAGKTPIVIDVNDSFASSANAKPLKEALRDSIRISETLANPDGDPTDETLNQLQRSFQRGRQESRRSLAFFIVAVVFAALAAAALWQSLSAESARREASLNARIALSRQLAAESRNVALTHPVRSLLLARASVLSVYPNGSLPPAAVAALIESVRDLPGVGIFPSGYASFIEGIYWNERRRELVAWGPGVSIWTLHGDFPDLIERPVDVETDVSACALSPDRELIAVSSISQRSTTLHMQGIGQPQVILDSELVDLAFSRDGTLLAGWDYTRGIHIWRIIAGRALHLGLWETDEPEFLGPLCFTPDGRWLVSGMLLWPLTMQTISAGERPTPVVLWGHSGAVGDIDVSYDSHWLVTGSSGEMGGGESCLLWDLMAADPAGSRQVLKGAWGSVNAVEISPDAHWIAAGIGKAVALWPLQESARRDSARLLTDHEEIVVDVAFDPHSRLLASASRDRTARVWRVDSLGGRPSPLAVLRGHDDYVEHVHFIEDGRRLATAGSDGGIRIWNVECPNPGDGSIWSIVAGPIKRAAFGSRGRWLAALVQGKEEYELIAYDLSERVGRPLIRKGQDFADRAEFAIVDDRLVVGDQRGISVWRMDPEGSLEWLARYKADETDNSRGWVSRLSPDGRWLASRGYREVILRNLQDSTLSGRYEFPTATEELKFDSSGRWAAVHTRDDKLYVWDLLRHDLAHPFRLDHKNDYFGWMAFGITPDSRWLITVERGARILVWDLTQKRLQLPERVLESRHTPILFTVFSPDSRWLAVITQADPVVYLWDLTDQEARVPAAELHSYNEPIAGCSFSPDSRRVAIWSREASIWTRNIHPETWISIWDIMDLRLNHVSINLSGDGSRVVAAGFGEGANTLFALTENRNVLRWELDVPTLVDQARRLAGRTLTPDERALVGLTGKISWLNTDSLTSIAGH
jgi:WD40 repeat protein